MNCVILKRIYSKRALIHSLTFLHPPDRAHAGGGDKRLRARPGDVRSVRQAQGQPREPPLPRARRRGDRHGRQVPTFRDRAGRLRYFWAFLKNRKYLFLISY